MRAAAPSARRSAGRCRSRRRSRARRRAASGGPALSGPTLSAAPKPVVRRRHSIRSYGQSHSVALLKCTPMTFPATRLSVVARTRSGDEETRRVAFAALIEAYWKPAYKYLRLKWSLDPDAAADLTQEFFTTTLEKDVIERYDPARARFRTYLRLCLDGFASQRPQGRAPLEARRRRDDRCRSISRRPRASWASRTRGARRRRRVVLPRMGAGAAAASGGRSARHAGGPAAP